VGDGAVAVVLLVGGAWVLGRQRPERVAHRAVRAREVGAIHFGEPAPTV